MAVLEATAIRIGRPPAESAPEAVVKVPVTCRRRRWSSARRRRAKPTSSPTRKIRVQFSRDLREDSLKGGVAVAYAGVDGAAAGVHGALRRRAARRRRSSSRRRCRRSRTSRSSLKETIVGTDGQPLRPYTLAFTVGS